MLKPIALLCLSLLPIISFAAAGLPSEDIAIGASQADWLLLITYILLALIFSFLCSVAEAVLLSITPSYIARLGESNPELSQRLKRLKQDNIDRSLAAILTLNTIAHTVGAIGSGAKATAVFGNAWFGVFSAVMTLLILFLSEIVPKTLGAVYWRSLAGVVARFVTVLIWSMYPLILLSEMLTRLISNGKSLHGFNRNEFVAMARVGAQSGHLAEGESRILHNLFSLDSLTAKDIMTPRTVIQAMPAESCVGEFLQHQRSAAFSRIPVFEGTLDKVTGFVLKTDILLHKALGEDNVSVSEFIRPLFSVPESVDISRLLELMLDGRHQVALVVDEYGGTSGLVSMEDVVETLLGTEILDEFDTIDDLRQFARQKWMKRASALGVDVSEHEPAPDKSPTH